MKHIAIVGAGQAGASLAARLRSLGFDGSITLLGDETAPPYQRPPLSKKYLKGEMALERLYLRPERFYRDNEIALRCGSRVTGIRCRDRVIDLDGETLRYDQLALTTGTAARRLPEAMGGNLQNVYVMRSLGDIDRMAHEFRPGRRVLILGGGYIGLEAAAVAADLDLEVTVVEQADRILQRVAAPETSDYFRQLHGSHGVTILEGAGLQRLIGGAEIQAILSDGASRRFDMVIVGIGVSPNDRLAADAGLKCDNGILVDSHGRTSDPHVWAAGDCARFDYRGALIRLESVQNAVDQAEVVAANMLGAETCYRPTPWFWSDQYDVKLQIAGLNTGHGDVVIRQGPSSGVRSHWYFAADDLLAVDAMNDPRSYMIGKRLIEAGRSPSRDQVRDPEFTLKSLL